MTIIYVVTEGTYSAYGIEALFSTKEKAQEYIDKKSRLYECFDGRIEEYKLDECSDIEYKKYWEAIIFTRTDLTGTKGNLDIAKGGEEWAHSNQRDNIEIGSRFIRVKSYISQEHANKVAIEQYQIYTQNQLEN